MRDVLRKESDSKKRIFRFIGGADLNSSPNLKPERFIIYFDDIDEEKKLDEWPSLKSIVEQYVRPQRLALPNKKSNARLRHEWWRYSQGREMRQATAKLSRIVACSQTSKHRMFVLIPGEWVIDQKVIGFARGDDGLFAILQSRVHVVWSDFFGSTMKDDPVYTPPTCFDSFPFADGWSMADDVARTGREYHAWRSAYMIEKSEGLTKTYNRFHDPEEDDPGIIKLRDLHATMDRAVLEAYGWRDLAEQATCEFQLAYEESKDDDDSPRKRKKKKPWRYKWPQDFHDEVLARLLELNQTYAEQERLACKPTVKKKKRNKKKATKKKKTADPIQVPLLGDD